MSRYILKIQLCLLILYIHGSNFWSSKDHKLRNTLLTPLSRSPTKTNRKNKETTAKPSDSWFLRHFLSPPWKRTTSPKNGHPARWSVGKSPLTFHPRWKDPTILRRAVENFETSRVASVSPSSGKFARSRALFPVGLACRRKYARRDLIRAGLRNLYIGRVRSANFPPFFHPFARKFHLSLSHRWMVTDVCIPRSRSSRHRDFDTRRTENFGQTILLLSYLI